MAWPDCVAITVSLSVEKPASRAWPALQPSSIQA